MRKLMLEIVTEQLKDEELHPVRRWIARHAVAWMTVGCLLGLLSIPLEGEGPIFVPGALLAAIIFVIGFVHAKSPKYTKGW